MKIPEINCILSDREIADMVDGIYKQNHEYYTIDENGFILGYKDQKRLAEKEYLTELLCKWRNINRWLNNGASPYERVTLAMIEEKEKELIIKALEKNHGKRKMAANDLGISERTLYRKLKEYNIEI